MYAVIEDGSRQYRVSEGDQLDLDFREANVGDRIEFQRVLLFSSNDGVQVGRPTVQDVKVVAEVLEQAKGEKIYIQKFKRRKNYHRRTGHRQPLTRVRIRQIIAAGQPS
jgi:large subunit ribosomal protein L21